MGKKGRENQNTFWILNANLKCKQMKQRISISSILSFDIQFENLTLADLYEEKKPQNPTGSSALQVFAVYNLGEAPWNCQQSFFF